jgi:RNA polymerase sigma-70 factor (ECF subfamily)
MDRSDGSPSNADETLRLTEAAANGDLRAFAKLIRHWDNDLRGVAWSVVRSATATDDVMQSTYEKALGSLAGFDGRSSLKTWLHAICYRTAIDHVRYESHRQHFGDESLQHVAAPASTSARALDRVQLAALLDQLKPEQRSLIMMTAGLGYSFDEVADITGLPRGTVASRVGRARDVLRAERAEQIETTENDDDEGGFA